MAKINRERPEYQAAQLTPNVRLRFIFGATGGLGPARPTGKIRGRARCPDRAVWGDLTHRELSTHCSFGTEHGGLHLIEKINRFEKLAVDLGPILVLSS